MKYFPLFFLILLLETYHSTGKKVEELVSIKDSLSDLSETSLIILGTVQDGGSPHIGCKKNCCKELFSHPELHRNVVSLGIIDPQNKKKYLIECTPDFPIQAKNLLLNAPFSSSEIPDAIFLTHAHIGHYSGLMYLGKEAINADATPVYVMPRMNNLLNRMALGVSWFKNKNIELHALQASKRLELTSNISITPIIVPHRDEFSETVGFLIEGPKKKVLFIPDIDKWEKWEQHIIDIVATVDFALIDGTFYDAAEINNRDISSIPHPFIIESMKIFKDLPLSEKRKIIFIHLNHTNKALDPLSTESKTIWKMGFRLHSCIKLFPFDFESKSFYFENGIKK